LLRIGGRGRAHLLHGPHGYADQDGQDGQRVRQRQIQPEEVAVQRHYLVRDGQPGVEVVGQRGQPLRTCGKQRSDGDVQADPDRELDDHRPQAPDGVDARFFVQAHGLLGEASPVFAVPLLQGLQLWLNLRHFLRRAYLPQSQRQGQETDYHREDQDGDAEVTP